MDIPLFLKNRFNFTEKSAGEIAEVLIYEKFPKGHFLYQKGEICQRIFFIEKGFARSYYISRNGKDITAWFTSDNDFVTALDSFSTKKPSRMNCELLEPSLVLSIDYSQMETMLKKNPELAGMAFYITMQILKKHSEYISSIKFQSAKERFHALMNDYPSIFLRVPLGHIASYLGMTQETLSRMRADI